jgi:elongation factor G
MQQSMDALLAADAAVICVSPQPGHAVLAAPYIRLAESAGVPTFLLVNRIDEAEAPARQDRRCGRPGVGARLALP